MYASGDTFCELGGKMKNKRIKCPCCGYYTIDDDGCVVITDICEVCYWQYDVVAQENPDREIGPNHGVSLNQARENYKNFGASSMRVKEFVRLPKEDEFSAD